MLTVNETAIHPPDEEGPSINTPKSLSMEATYINHNFTQQVLECFRSCIPCYGTGILAIPPTNT